MMHPSDVQWWRAHAADYVLGLLSNSERLVFERILPTEPKLQEFVVDWRQKLHPISDAIPPIQPPDHILPALIANIPVATDQEESPYDDSYDDDLSSTLDNSASVGRAMVVASAGASSANEFDDYDDDSNSQMVSHAGVDHTHSHLDPNASAEVLADGTAFMQLVESKQAGMDSWRTFAGLATAACMLVGIFGFMGFHKSQAEKVEPRFDGISVVQDENEKTLWVVDSSANAKKLRVTAVAPPALEQGQAFELWMENPDDGGVVSMGLLPTQSNASAQINAQRFSAEAQTFSVSVESSEGSPESIPTGPVLYRGSIQALSN